MAREVIHTDKAPGAVGPYSQAIKSDGLVFVSGQVALDPTSGELFSGSIEDETTKAMQNVNAVLEAAGAELANVLKATIYVTNMDDFARVNEAYGSFFETDPPARATVGVAALPKGARVEIECVARV